MSSNSIGFGCRYHFVGIGGIGMCGLAELLKNMGAEVSGSDLSDNPQTRRLKNLAIPVFHEHKAENLGDVDVLVFSSAVKMDNPEVVEARRKKIPIIRRAEALAELMRLKRGVAIAGTHGKTTTTSLAAAALVNAGVDPTVVVGGRLGQFESTAKLGQGEWLIAEADESDGSFHRLSPEIVVITNIDNDHMDHYGSFETLKRAFHDFAFSVPFYGLVIGCGDDEVLNILLKDFPKRSVTYGFGESNDYFLRKDGEGYKVYSGAELLGRFESPVPGDHNALNALAVIVLGLHLELPFVEIVEGLESFKGVDRRFQLKGKAKGVLFYDDYGHHPTEVLATLKGFKEHFSDKNLKVVFQPHRYSRTQLCWDDFLTSFENADQLFIADIYPAGEEAMEGVSSQNLVEQMKHSSVSSLDIKDAQKLEAFVGELREGDVVLTLGAGDVYKFGEQILERMAKA